MKKVSFLVFLAFVSFSSKEVLAASSSSSFTVSFVIEQSCQVKTNEKLKEKNNQIDILCSHEVPYQISESKISNPVLISYDENNKSHNLEQKVVTITY